MNKDFDIVTEMQKGQGSYLSPDNKRLLYLIQRYSDLSIPAVSPSRWSRDYINDEVSLNEEGVKPILQC